MARNSKIEGLDGEVRDAVDALIRKGATLDDIVAHLREVGVDDISRSSVHRYRKTYEQVASEMRRYREMAAGFASELGAVEDSEAHQVIVQMLHTMLMRSGMEAIEGDSPMDPKDLMFLGRTVKDLMSSVGDREKLKREIEKQIRTEAAENAATAAKAQGLSAAGVAAIRRTVLGVAE